MAVDPKVVGGGAAVVAIGGGSGYAISQAVDSSNTSSQSPETTDSGLKNSPAPAELPDHKTINKKALSSAGFQIENNKENEGDCKTKLENKTLSTENEFKAAVKSCVVGKKFADKARHVGLDVLDASNKDNWDTENWWSTKKSSIQTSVSGLDQKNNWTEVKDVLSNFCTDSSKGNKEINENSQDDDWKKFLTTCTKDKTTEGKKVTVESVAGKDFWTGK